MSAATAAADTKLLVAYSQVNSPVSLKMWVSPYASQPGDPLWLNLELSSQDANPIAPQIELTIPRNVNLDLTGLPAGVAFNVQTSSLTWQPVIPGQGTIQLALPLEIPVVDLRLPDQKITARVKFGNQEQLYETSYWVGFSPNTSITVDPPQVAIGQPVHLVSEIDGPGPFTEQWHLGDGRTVAVPDPVVVYSMPGIYEVRLDASNAVGTTSISSQVLVIAQPIAKFSTSSQATVIGSPISFINQSGGQTPLSYSWDFGDGNYSNEPNPIHLYNNPGSYQVHLVIENELGQSDAFLTIEVGNPPPAEILLPDAYDSGLLLEAQAFTDGTSSQIDWDMGDGSHYEGEVINHVYWSPGDYLVTITIRNQFGETTVQKWIHIGPGTLYMFLPFIVHGGDSQLGESIVDQTLTVDQSKIDDSGSLMISPLELSPDMPLVEQLLTYINEARKINGLAPVKLVNELNQAAQLHTEEMANNSYTGHRGADGSSPALRVQRTGYNAGYLAEATAWGMQKPIEPVQYWLTSPDHRPIILDPAATDIGVGFTQNYGSPNVWYWTVDFASANLPPLRVPEIQPLAGIDAIPAKPEIQLLGPPQASEFQLNQDNKLIFTWTWPDPLASDFRFVIYLRANGRIYQIGSTRDSSGNQYQFTTSAALVPAGPGLHEWQVRLEDRGSASTIFESEFWPITFSSN